VDATARYVETVDRVLAAACGLLPPPDGTPAGLESPAGAVDAPEDASGLATGVAGAVQRYRRVGERMSALDDAAGGAVREAARAARQPADAAAAVRGNAQARVTALLPVAHTPAGLRTLVDSMASSLASMHSVLSSTQAQMSGAAEELRHHRDDWQGVPGD